MRATHWWMPQRRWPRRTSDRSWSWTRAASPGLITDRDIVVRAIAEGRDPGSTAVRDVCSSDVVTVTQEQDLDEAIRLMREHDVRRVPVVQDGRPVGILSLGDVAVEREPDSALADISAAPPND